MRTMRKPLVVRAGPSDGGVAGRDRDSGRRQRSVVRSFRLLTRLVSVLLVVWPLLLAVCLFRPGLRAAAEVGSCVFFWVLTVVNVVLAVLARLELGGRRRAAGKGARCG